MGKLNRRDFIKVSGMGAALAASVGSGAVSFTFARKGGNTNLPKPHKNSPRVVIVGGGWSGSTLAK